MAEGMLLGCVNGRNPCCLRSMDDSNLQTAVGRLHVGEKAGSSTLLNSLNIWRRRNKPCAFVSACRGSREFGVVIVGFELGRGQGSTPPVHGMLLFTFAEIVFQRTK